MQLRAGHEKCLCGCQEQHTSTLQLAPPIAHKGKLVWGQFQWLIMQELMHTYTLIGTHTP